MENLDLKMAGHFNVSFQPVLNQSVQKFVRDVCSFDFWKDASNHVFLESPCKSDGVMQIL
jgi:hypothetical protein